MSSNDLMHAMARELQDLRRSLRRGERAYHDLLVMLTTELCPECMRKIREAMSPKLQEAKEPDENPSGS